MYVYQYACACFHFPQYSVAKPGKQGVPSAENTRFSEVEFTVSGMTTTSSSKSFGSLLNELAAESRQLSKKCPVAAHLHVDVYPSATPFVSTRCEDRRWGSSRLPVHDG